MKTFSIAVVLLFLLVGSAFAYDLGKGFGVDVSVSGGVPYSVDVNTTGLAYELNASVPKEQYHLSAEVGITSTAIVPLRVFGSYETFTHDLTFKKVGIDIPIYSAKGFSTGIRTAYVFKAENGLANRSAYYTDLFFSFK